MLRKLLGAAIAATAVTAAVVTFLSKKKEKEEVEEEPVHFVNILSFTVTNK